MKDSSGGLKKYKIVLILFSLVIISLGAVNVVVFLNRNNSGNENENTYPTSMHTSELEAINEEAKELPTEEAVGLYERVISNATDDKDRAEARIEYGRYLFEQGDTAGMLVQFEQVDEEKLDAGYKILLYDALSDYYFDIGDVETCSKYSEMISEVIRNSDYATGA